MWPELEIGTEQRDGVTVLHLDGELDIYSAPRLREAVIGLDRDGRSAIVLDMGKCEYADSTGLGVIVGALKRARSAAGDLVLCALQQRVHDTFRMTALTKVFTICGTVDEAIAALKGAGLTDEA